MNAPVEVRPVPSRLRKGLRRAQLSDEVAGYLRAAIVSGTLRPGTFIRLDDTAAQLGVSITPVREALLTLRGEGMVRLEPHRGHVVLRLSRKDIEDIFWLQSVIAKELAAAATEIITDEAIDELEKLNHALGAAVAAADSDAVVTAEFTFHRAFNRTTGRVKLAWFLLHVARYMPELVYAADPGWGAGAVDNHRQLIAALRVRDTAAVVKLTAWQFSDASKRLTAMLDKSGIWT